MFIGLLFIYKSKTVKDEMSDPLMFQRVFHRSEYHCK